MNKETKSVKDVLFPQLPPAKKMAFELPKNPKFREELIAKFFAQNNRELIKSFTKKD